MFSKLPKIKRTSKKRTIHRSPQDNYTLDKVLIYIFLSLTIFGLIMVYSSSFINIGNNPFYYFIRQIIFILIGLISAFFAYKIDLGSLKKLILPGLILSIILLIVVLIPGVGTKIHGASRWIDFGLFNIQPSEVTKLTFTLYLASWASNQKKYYDIRKENVQEYLKTQLGPFLGLLGIICGLVLLEPDLATTGIIGLTSLGVYLLSGRDSMHTLGTILITSLLILSGLVAAVIAPYRMARVRTYIDFLVTGEVQDPKDSGYQLRNMLIAVGSGGLFGTGFGESRQKYHYLGDTAFSDNIFAVIAEEFGMVGSTLLVSVYMYIFLRGIKLAEKIPDRFPKLLASGIIIWFTLQAFLHISANIGLIPVTGITLPFISYGGSSIIPTLVASGLFLNVTKNIHLHN